MKNIITEKRYKSHQLKENRYFSWEEPKNRNKVKIFTILVDEFWVFLSYKLEINRGK